MFRLDVIQLICQKKNTTPRGVLRPSVSTLPPIICKILPLVKWGESCALQTLTELCTRHLHSGACLMNRYKELSKSDMQTWTM